MKKLFCTLTVLATLGAMAQNSASTKAVLLEQLKSTHNVKNWFVPGNTALEGLTAEKALWTDGSGNH